MKKILALMAAVLLAFALAGCDGEPTGQTPIEDNLGTPDIQTAAHIETLNEGDSVIEYVEVSGLPDIAVQDALNEEMKTFFTWVLVDLESADKTVEVLAEYEIIGNRYISIRAYDLEIFEGAAHPATNLRANTYDLITGDAVLLDAFIADINGIKALDDSIFAPQVIEELVPAALEKLKGSLGSNSTFYLLQDRIGFSIEGENHATGDYWVFEVSYADISDLLTAAYQALI